MSRLMSDRSPGTYVVNPGTLSSTLSSTKPAGQGRCPSSLTGRQHGQSAFTPHIGPIRTASIAPSRAVSTAPGTPRTPDGYEDREDPRPFRERDDAVACRRCPVLVRALRAAAGERPDNLRLA